MNQPECPSHTCRFGLLHRIRNEDGSATDRARCNECLKEWSPVILAGLGIEIINVP